MASSFGVKTKYTTKQVLTDFTKSRPHQNVVLKTSKLDYIPIKSFQDIQIFTNGPKDEGRLVLLLDGITDPMNFGSILRSSMFLGVDAVIVNKKDAPGLTPTVSKVSSGALEFLPIYSVKFVKNFLEDLKKNEGFLIVSTNIDDESPNVKQLDRKLESEVQNEDSDSKEPLFKHADQDIRGNLSSNNSLVSVDQLSFRKG